MDLAQLDTSVAAETGAVMHLNGPDGAPLFTDDGKPLTITLLGSDGKTLTTLTNRQANAFLRNRSQVITAEMAMTNEIERLATATTAWSNIVLEGKALECNLDNARALYRRLPWVRDQVRAFIDDRANFLTASPKS